MGSPFSLNLIYRVIANEWTPQYKKEKLWFCCVLKSKIFAHGWQAWKNWFFILLTFLAGVTFWSIIFGKNDQKMTQAKKIAPKKSVLWYYSTMQEFLKSMFYFQTFLSEFCHSCALPFLRQNVKEGHQSTQNY